MAVDPNIAIGQGDAQITPPPRERLYDYYVRPQEPQRSPLHDLAAALAPLSGDLEGLAAQQQVQQNKADFAEGQFWANNAEGAAEAVRNGTLPADRSLAFRNGVAATAGMNDALRFHQGIGPDYNSLDKTTTDPQAFDQWFFQRAQGAANPNLANNPTYAKTYAEGMAKIHASMSEQFTKDRSDAVMGMAQRQFSASLGLMVTQAQPSGSSAVDVESLAGNIDQMRQLAISQGMDPKFVETEIIKTLQDHAAVNRNSSVMGVLDHLTTDPNDPNSPRMGEGGDGFAAKKSTEQTVNTLLNQDRERQHKEQDYQDKKASISTITNIVQQWTGGKQPDGTDIPANPNYQPTPQEIATIAKVDPLFPAKMAEYRKNILAGEQGTEDPQQVTDLMTRLYQQGDMQQVFDARAAGLIKTDATLKAAVEAVNTGEKYRQSGGVNRILDDPTAKRFVGTIEGLTANPKWVQNVVGSPRITMDGQKAINDFSVALMQHQLANPGEDPIARQKYINELGTQIVGGIQNQNSDDFKTHAYKTPDAVTPQLGPQTHQQSSTALPPAPTQRAASTNAPAAFSVPPGGTVKDALSRLPAPPQFGTLPPQYQQLVAKGAAEAGLDPQAALNEMWKRSQPGGTPAGGAPSPATPATPGTPGKQGAVEGGTQTASAAPLSFPLPGGGHVELHGVSPDIGGHLQTMSKLLASVKPEQMQGLVNRMQSQGQQPGAAATPQGGDTPDKQMEAGENNMADRGALSAKYESAKESSGAIARDNTGGWSYGRYQFASGGTVANGSAVKGFIATLQKEAPDLAKKLTDAGGQPAAKAGSAQFKAAWQEASKDPRFRTAEDDAAWSELVGPAVAMTKQETGLDVNQRSLAVQSVMWSTAIQHGGSGAAHLWRNALGGRDPNEMSDAELINALYNERSRVERYFHSSTPQVQQSVKNRFAHERRDALAMLQQEGPAPTKVAEADTTQTEE